MINSEIFVKRHVERKPSRFRNSMQPIHEAEDKKIIEEEE
jgi:hypothetical protein